MNEEIMQAPDMTAPVDNQVSPEEAKASLGLSTRLSEQFLMQQMAQEQAMMPAEAPQEAEMSQGGEMMPETEKEPEEDKMMAMEGKMDEKMEILRTELKETIKTEIESIRNDIKSALENEED